MGNGRISMRVETAVSLIGIVMEALSHRETCLKKPHGDAQTELLVAAFEMLEEHGAEIAGARAWLSQHGLNLPKASRVRYQRRANNQTPAKVEELIAELLDRGWTKTAIAKHLKV